MQRNANSLFFKTMSQSSRSKRMRKKKAKSQVSLFGSGTKQTTRLLKLPSLSSPPLFARFLSFSYPLRSARLPFPPVNFVRLFLLGASPLLLSLSPFSNFSSSASLLYAIQTTAHSDAKLLEAVLHFHSFKCTSSSSSSSSPSSIITNQIYCQSFITLFSRSYQLYRRKK